MKTSLFLLLLLMASSTVAAQQMCICTAGCRIAVDTYPPGGGQPTLCTVYKGGVAIGSASVVASNTIPSSNTTVCLPANPTYNPGVAGSVTCEVPIPGQAPGLVSITMRASNSIGETADSAVYTFQSVSAFPTLPQVPVNLRPN